MADLLTSLPLEIWLNITQYLFEPQINILAQVCHSTNSICSSEEMYRDLLIRCYFTSIERLFTWMQMNDNALISFPTPYKNARFLIRDHIDKWCKSFPIK